MTDIHAALGTSTPLIRLMHPPVPKPSRNVRRYAFMAATIALVIAVATAGYFAIGSNSTTPPPTEVPEVVLGLASQESTPSPVAETCDFTGDIPLISGVDESPLDGTSVIVTLDQELKLVCEAQETVLAEDVQIATPTQTPYVLQLITQTGSMLLNVSTGESLQIPQPPAMVQQTIGMQTWAQWALLPSTENVDGLSLYLMESFNEIPVMVGNDAVDLDTISGMVIGANDDVIALGITDDLGEGSKILTGLFIANSNGTSHSVQTPGIHDPSQFAISPDGSTVAVVSYVGEQNVGNKTLSLIDTADGSLINEIEIGTDPNFIDLNWLNDGSALLYTNSTGLHMLTEPDGEPTTILEGDNVVGLALTRNDNIIAITHRAPAESGPGTSMTTIINLATDERTEYEGRDLFTGSSMVTQRSTLLLADPITVPSNDPVEVTAVNAATGETVGELEFTVPEDGYQYSSWGFDRDINVVGFGPDAVWRLTDAQGEPALIQVPAPPIDTDDENVPVHITVTPNGTMSLRTFTPNFAFILLPGEEEWIEIDLPEPSDSQGVNANVGIIIGND